MSIAESTQQTSNIAAKKMAYKVIKTGPGNVLFIISPVDNPNIRKEVYLTNRHPQQTLPLNYALDVFLDDGLFNLYQEGYFTFDDPEGLKAEAVAEGYYFDNGKELKPAKPTQENDILAILKKGVRSEILQACNQYGGDIVRNTATEHIGELTQSVVQMLEKLWNVQFTIEGAE